MVTSASAAHIADQSERGCYGSAMGALGSIMDIGHTAGPVVGGVLAFTIGLELAFTFSSVVLVVGGCWFFFQGRVSN